MYVAFARVRLLLPGNHSLKGKRHLLRRVVERIRGKHSVAVAEVAEQDKWQVAVIGMAAVGNEGHFARTLIDSALATLSHLSDVPVAQVDKGLVGPEMLSERAAGGAFDLPFLEERYDVFGDEEEG